MFRKQNGQNKNFLNSLGNIYANFWKFDEVSQKSGANLEV